MPFLDTCSFNPRLKPDQTQGNFSGPVGSDGREELQKVDLLPKLGTS